MVERGDVEIEANGSVNDIRICVFDKVIDEDLIH